MTTPDTTKTIRVSPETHRRIFDLAERLGGTADEALARLLDESTVRIQLSETQRKRWSEAANGIGVSIPEFAMLRVEAALQFGTDPGTMQLIYNDVRRLARPVDAMSTRRPADTDASTGRPPQ